MTDLSHGAAAPPDPSPSTSGSRRTALALVVGAVLLAAAGIAVVLVSDSSPDHPSEWDERVVDLVAFVEEERGLAFEHPVHVDFLSEDEFRAEVTARDELDDDERAQLESLQAMLRALGLVSGDIDLLEVGDTLLGDGVVGFYRFEDRRVVVRGEELDDQRRSTLVHELTHALQDQHFDIGDSEPETSGAAIAFTAVLEADAVLVERAWRETLPETDRSQLDDDDLEAFDEVDFEGVPDVFVEMMGFPYVFGPPFLEAVIDELGQEGRDRAFTDPPTTEQHILLPATYLEGRVPREVATPALTDDEEAIDESEDDLGMLSLLVVLAERLEFSTAWAAVQGWAGDAMVAFERDGLTCVRAEVVFDDAESAGRLADAFAEWSEGLPASHRRDGEGVLLESCDPGAEVERSRAEGHVSGIQGLGLRMALADSFADEGLGATEAMCLADGLLAELSANRILELDEILDDDLAHPGWAELGRAVSAVAPGCL